MPINSRAKGQRGEREIIGLLQPIVDTVTYDLGLETLLLQRNTIQSDRGGYDIVGLPWFAPEVKWCEVLQVRMWWEQCLRQSKSHQTPVLFYKSNHAPWTVMMNGGVGFGEVWTPAVVEVKMELFQVWFAEMVRVNLKSRI